MKQRTFVVVALSVVALSLLACQTVNIPLGRWVSRTVHGSGDVIPEDRAVSDFSQVELATQGTLHIDVGDREALRVEAEENLLPYIETEVSGESLIIRTQPNTNLRTTKPIQYYLTVSRLDGIVLTSSGDAVAPDLEGERFSVTLSSSGNLEMGDLRCDVLIASLTSSGDATIGMLYADRIEASLTSAGILSIAGGEVRWQDITLSSSGDYDARDLESDEAVVSLPSSGSATIRVRNQLRATLNSSGSVYYLGNPTVDATATSSGKVVPLRGGE